MEWGDHRLELERLAMELYYRRGQEAAAKLRKTRPAPPSSSAPSDLSIILQRSPDARAIPPAPRTNAGTHEKLVREVNWLRDRIELLEREIADRDRTIARLRQSRVVVVGEAQYYRA